MFKSSEHIACASFVLELLVRRNVQRHQRLHYGRPEKPQIRIAQSVFDNSEASVVFAKQSGASLACAMYVPHASRVSPGVCVQRVTGLGDIAS